MVTCKSLQQECRVHLSDLDVEVVGKRDLDLWVSSSKEQNFTVLKEAEVIWNPNHLTILYAGCYGNHYSSDFQLFLESIKACQTLSTKPIDVWIALHPAKECTGAVEMEEINKLTIKNAAIVKKGVPTIALLPFANMLVSATSSTVLNAAAYGTFSFYACREYTNYLIDKKILPRAANTEQFVDLFAKFNASGSEESLSLSKEIPENAAQNIANYLNQIVESVQREANLKVS